MTITPQTQIAAIEALIAYSEKVRLASIKRHAEFGIPSDQIGDFSIAKYKNCIAEIRETAANGTWQYPFDQNGYFIR